MDSMLNWALRYAEYGWYVFPCREVQGRLYADERGKLHLPAAKSPYIRDGLLNATTDAAKIREWWSRWPGAAIGCNCGKSGLFVFDCDMKDGRNGWATFRSMGIDHTGAFHSQTPTFGYHIIYSGHGKSGSNIGTGLDTRGEGGYIILPPSKISGKGNYIILDVVDWFIRRPAPIPAIVLERLFKPLVDKPAARPLPENNPDEQLRQARAALAVLDPSRAENYADWVSVGMALYALGGQGLSLWHEFSARSPKYKSAELDAKWETFRAGGLGLASVFYWADQDAPGWRKQNAK